jgi:hypothetical protein
MRRNTWLLVLVGCLALPVGVGAKRRPEAERCPADVEDALARQCPCAGITMPDGSVEPWATHGGYVSCVVRAMRGLGRAGCLSARERRTLVRCAAHSTCGRDGTVVCCFGEDGTCEPNGAEGACSNDPDRACDTDLECRRRARIAADASRCTAAGGWIAPQASACGGCVTTTTTSSTTTTTSTTSTTTSTTTTTTIPGGTYGNAVEFPGASTHAPGYLVGGPVSVPRSCTLTHLALIAKAAGPQVKLALYSSRNGAPYRLIAAAPATPVTVGSVEVGVGPVPIVAGTYWLMGVYDTDASIGIDETDPTAPVRYVAQSFASPVPDPFPSAFSYYSGQRFNYYVRVLE